MKKNKAIEIVSALLILLFVYAAVSKLLDYENSKVQMAKSPFITGMAAWLVWALPVGELVTALLLAWPRTRLWGLYSSLFLMTLFTAYIYATLHVSHFLPCTCGGVLSMMSWDQHLVFNVFFVLLSVAGILLTVARPQNDGTEVEFKQVFT